MTSPRRPGRTALLRSPVGGGLRPAPLARSVFLPISVGSEYLPISRRGGPMCPPGHAFLRDPPTGRHAGRPLQILLQSSSTPKNRAGTEPRPYSRRTSNVGSRSTRPSSLSSSARRRSARNDRRHQGLPLPSPVPTAPVSAKRPRSSFGKSPVTVTPGWFPKEGPQPFLWPFPGRSAFLRRLPGCPRKEDWKPCFLCATIPP